VACWDIDSSAQVVVIHDFATPGWEQQAHISDFYSWFRLAIEDLIAFDSG
jgi:hypothetical protein